MAMASYKQVYAALGFNVWAPTGTVCDHLFVWKGNLPVPAVAGAAPVLADVLSAWNAATLFGGTPYRSIYFCQSFDLSNIAVLLPGFLATAEAGNAWNLFAYWTNLVFDGNGIVRHFPNGTDTPIEVSDLMLTATGASPASLSDFVIDADGAGTALTLQLTVAAFQWNIGNASGAPQAPLLLPLMNDSDSTSGAIGLPIATPPQVPVGHPVRRTRFVYHSAPNYVLQPGDVVPLKLWYSELTDRVDTADGQCLILLDPRDLIAGAPWLAGTRMNSRVEFEAATLHTSLFGATGQRFVLDAQGTGRARLGVVVELIDDRGNLSTNGTVIFHPEGQFGINGPAAPADPANLNLNLSARDLIAGPSSTEFLDLSLATHVEFVPRQSAFFLEDENQKPMAPWLDSKGGLAVTSHVQFLSGPTAVPYFTQASEAPLFAPTGASAGAVVAAPQPQDVTINATHLLRQRNIFGSMAVPPNPPPPGPPSLVAPLAFLPIFPHAGYAGSASDPLVADLHHFESTHLSAYRRDKVARQASGAVTALLPAEGEQTALAAEPAARPAAAPGKPPTTRGVTPQGLLADVAVNGEYVKLYFGNPDSQAVLDDFWIALNATTSDLYTRLQSALAGSQLFVVVRNTAVLSADAQSVISVGATLRLNDFTFTVGADSTVKAAADAPNPSFMMASTLLIKFYKGKSLAELAQDRRLWVCADDLAPVGGDDSGGTWPPFQSGAPTPDSPLQNLWQIWNDRNWQGVLALNAPITMPSILEALRPGLYAKAGQDPVLRAHHFGLNAVPLQKKDVNPSATTSPQRFCSGFGVVQYSYQAGLEPQTPAANDLAPSVDPAQGKVPTNAAYSFVVGDLQIAFLKSQIVNFSATVNVGFSHLFWDQIDAGSTPGTITLVGTYESQRQPDGSSKDVFSLTTQTALSPFQFRNSYIASATITRAQLSVVSADANNTSLTAAILLDVTLTLAELTPIPLFTVKAIRLSNFGFTYTYARSATAPPAFSFAFKPGGISADIEFGDPGGLVQSVLSMLPVTLKGISIAVDSLIDIAGDLHYTLVNFGSVQGPDMSRVHFAFQFEIDFGSLGGLAGVGNLRLPLLMGWRAALPHVDGFPDVGRGIAFGIQFPSLNGSVDFGIQQFMHIHADSLNVFRCPPDPGSSLAGMGVQLVNTQITMFGEQFPGTDVQPDLLFFIPIAAGRKGSWAFGLEAAKWYLGGGYRINVLAGGSPGSLIDTKAVVAAYRSKLQGLTSGAAAECQFLSPGNLKSSSDNWSVMASYKEAAAYSLDLAISDADPTVYGVNIGISDFDLDLLYQRVNDQLGIFSVELALPLEARTFQFGAATVRLPVFRMELHTDGGYLLDFGFPWGMDYSRSAQVEVYIFVGSGGFYYGNTSSAADPNLKFEDSYGFTALDDQNPADYKLQNAIRDTRVGYASRGGIGRSFTFGILNADASLTLFGSLEGSSAYLNSKNVTPQTSLFHPLLFAISGTMGLMLDIQISVDFGIIQASAHLLAYVDFSISFRRVLAKQGGQYFQLTLPIVISTDVALAVTLDVRIHIGCVNITIHLHFSATWHVQFTLGGLGHVSYPYPFPTASGKVLDAASLPRAFAMAAPAALPPPVLLPATWTGNFAYWAAPVPLKLYVTVLSSVSDATVSGNNAVASPAAVGAMLLGVEDAVGGFPDFVTLLAAWALLQTKPGLSTPPDPNTLIYLQDVVAIQNQLSPGPNPFVPDKDHNGPRLPPDPDVFWSSFPAALMDLVGAQFTPTLNYLPDGTNSPAASDAIPYAVVPLWPKCKFTWVLPTGPVAPAAPVNVTDMGTSIPADQAAFAEYCRHLMVEMVLEVRQMLESIASPPHAPDTSMKWSDVLTKLAAPLSPPPPPPPPPSSVSTH